MTFNCQFDQNISRIQFACLGVSCPNNCCGAFNGFDDHLVSICNISHRNIVLLPKDIENLKLASRQDLIIDASGCSFIKTYEDGRCYAHKDGQCSIYEHRPTICRAYPFYLDMFTGICIQTSCPGVGHGHTSTRELQQCCASAREVYEFWIKKVY